jgi:hypothetical protein
VTRKLLILVALLVTGPLWGQQTARSQGQITVVNNVTPPPPQGLGWTDITGQQQANVCPPNPGTPGACNGVVDAWSGGWTDTTRNRMCWEGGGHTDYSGNEVYCYDIATKTVLRMDNPSTPTMCVTTNSDNTPSSRHNYGSLVYIPGADRVFEFGGGGWCNAGFASSDTWVLNPAQLGTGAPNGWLARDPTANPGSTHPDGSLNNMQAAYDPNTGLVFVNDNVGGSGLWSYNVSTNFYTNLNTQPANLQLHTRIVVDPTRKLIVRFGDGQVSTIDISSGSSYAAVTKTGTGCSALMNANNPGLAYDPILNVITGWPNFGPTVYLYNATTDSCTTQTYTANAPPDSHHTGSPSTTNGTFGRFAYFPKPLNLYVLVNEWNIDVHTLVLTNANTDFAAQCAAPGVLLCQGFDTSAALAGNTAAGVPVSSCGLTCPSIDTTTLVAGTGSLLFTVPAGATQANTSGSFNTNFTADLSQQIDSLINGDPLSTTTACGGGPCSNTVYVQWRERVDSGMLQHFANSNGFKSVIIGEGDAKRGSTFYAAYSCSDIETDTQNSSQFNIAQMYYSCGEFLNQYFNLYTPAGTDIHGNSIWSPENVAGGYIACTYTTSINIPTVPPCFPYVANNWMSFQVEISVGTWYPTGTNGGGGPPATFLHDSTIKMWAGLAGQPSQLIIDYHPGATSPACDATQQAIPACQTGFDLSNPTAFPSGCTTTSAVAGNCNNDGYGNPIREKFGKVWLLPYQTNLNCPACTVAHMWMDNLIVSKNRIADPQF